jgi:hypothetical protein
MTRASEAPSPMASDLPDVTGSLGDLRLNPPKENHELQGLPRPDRTEVVGVLDHVRDSSWISSCQGWKTDSCPCLARQVATLVRNALQPTHTEDRFSRVGSLGEASPSIMVRTVVYASPLLSLSPQELSLGLSLSRSSQHPAVKRQETPHGDGRSRHTARQQHTTMIKAHRRLAYGRGATMCFPRRAKTSQVPRCSWTVPQGRDPKRTKDPPRDLGPPRSCCATTSRQLHVPTS